MDLLLARTVLMDNSPLLKLPLVPLVLLVAQPVLPSLSARPVMLAMDLKPALVTNVPPRLHLLVVSLDVLLALMVNSQLLKLPLVLPALMAVLLALMLTLAKPACLDTDLVETHALNVPPNSSLLVDQPLVLFAPLENSPLLRPPLALLVPMDVPNVLLPLPVRLVPLDGASQTTNAPLVLLNSSPLEDKINVLPVPMLNSLKPRQLAVLLALLAVLHVPV